MSRPTDRDAPAAPLPGEAHLWLADLDAAAEPPDGVLSAAERERAAGIRAAVDARRWATSRWALREVLARYLGVAGSAIELARGEHGKPRLAAAPAPLEFNLSHSHGRVLVGVAAAGQPLGVDIERIVPRRDFLALARRALGEAEAEAIAAAPQERRAGLFYAAWTAHEAHLKCGGGGFGVAAPTGTPGARPVDVGDGYAAAFALAAAGDPRGRLYRLDLR